MTRCTASAAVASLSLAALLASSGCKEAPSSAGPNAAPASAVPSNAATVPATADFRVTVEGARGPGDAPPWRFTLVADAPPGADGMLAVRAIEVRRATSPELVQRLEGLDTRTPHSTETPGLEQVDMDFDGLPDLRLQTDAPAGPNVPYRHWLYDPPAGRFTASPALDALTSPTFDVGSREVVDRWRDGAARYGTDRYVWQDGRLVGVTRETREGLRPGVSTVKRYRGSAQAWVLEDTREARDR
jgi:hypothetical protein